MTKVLITDYDIEGRGITRINNVVTFVNNAMIKEIVDIEIVKKNKNFFEGKVVKFIQKSEKRLVPKCPYYFNCGGCNLMHMNYEEELLFKEKKVKTTLTKIIKEKIKVNKIIPADEILNYRNKVTFQVKNAIGFFEEKSNRFLRIGKCLLCDNRINKLISKLELIDLTNINKIILRASKYTDDVMVIIDSSKDIESELLENNISLYLKKNNQYVLKQGKGKIIEKMDEFDFYISPSSFFQVNTAQAIKLYNKIKEYASLNGTEKILDLYCGTGTIGIFLSKQAKKVYGIEINEEAIKDANLNKKINDIKNIEFYALNANQFLKVIKEKIDILIVDPPRSGLDKKTLDSILKLNPIKIIYVSCNISTLARDLDNLKKSYKILELTPIDMFPRTCHCESITVLERR